MERSTDTSLLVPYQTVAGASTTTPLNSRINAGEVTQTEGMTTKKPLLIISPDTSTGDKEAFKIDMQVSPHKVLLELCLSGISQGALQALGEALPDTGAMPGTYTSSHLDAGSETETIANQLGTMISQLMANSQGSKGTATHRVTINTQWSSLSQTGLQVGMTEAKFNGLHTSFFLGNGKGELFNVQVHDCRSPLPPSMAL